MRKWLALVALLCATVIITAQTPLTNALNLRVRTDSNGYLIVSSGTYASPDSPLTAFANTRLRTDSNGYLLITSSGGTGFATLGANTFVGDQNVTGSVVASVNMQATNAVVSNYKVNNVLWCGSSSATIGSGFNTSPTASATGSCAFTVSPGATGATNTGVVTLPAATTGWNCNANDLTDGGYVSQVAMSTTSASFKYYSRTTGLAQNWPTTAASISVQCGAR